MCKKFQILPSPVVMARTKYSGVRQGSDKSRNRDNSPLSEWIAYGFVITAFSVTERILVVFVREAKAL